jgi:hypothetical protein
VYFSLFFRKAKHPLRVLFHMGEGGRFDPLHGVSTLEAQTPPLARGEILQALPTGDGKLQAEEPILRGMGIFRLEMPFFLDKRHCL